MSSGDSFYLCAIGTVSSAGLERCLDRAEVAGSNPARFTSICAHLAHIFFIRRGSPLYLFHTFAIAKIPKHNNMETTTSLETFEVTIPEKYADTLKQFVKALDGKVKKIKAVKKGCKPDRE